MCNEIGALKMLMPTPYTLATSEIKINGTLTQIPTNVIVMRGPSMEEFVFKFMDEAHVDDDDDDNDDDDDDHDDDDDDDWRPPLHKPSSTSVTMKAAKAFILTLIALELFH